jgi:hypothetical protein
MRYGLGVQFEDRPGNTELGRLVESTVWINQAHPAYRRALASRSVGYHISLAVALALAPLAVEPDQEHIFITKFCPTGAKHSISPKDTVVARVDERATQRSESARGSPVRAFSPSFASFYTTARWDA